MSNEIPKPNYEEEFVNALHYFRCLDEEHQKELITQIRHEFSTIENKDTIVIKKIELEYTYVVLELLNDISKELQFKEPSISKRIANLSFGGKNTIRKYMD